MGFAGGRVRLEKYRALHSPDRSHLAACFLKKLLAIPPMNEFMGFLANFL